VEDDVTVRFTFSTVLDAAGYEVSTATDGFDALLQLKQQIPDVILSDLNMPEMSGFVAASGAYSSSAVPAGVLADAFFAKGVGGAASLLQIIAELVRTGAIDHAGQNAPIWIPRNGRNDKGIPFVVLTCTHCLRSFPCTVEHEPAGEILAAACIYCQHEVRYIIDFSRSVNSPQQRPLGSAGF